jgi:hypothetical protein
LLATTLANGEASVHERVWDGTAQPKKW